LKPPPKQKHKRIYGDLWQESMVLMVSHVANAEPCVIIIIIKKTLKKHQNRQKKNINVIKQPKKHQKH